MAKVNHYPRKPTRKKKQGILIIGDESVRNLGTIMNENSDIDAHVVVRGGATLGSIGSQIGGDIQRMKGKTDIIICSLGSHILRSETVYDTKKRANFLIKKIETFTQNNNIVVGLIGLPPQREAKINKKVEVNHLIKQRCERSNSKITFLPPPLLDEDLGRDGIHAHIGGRRKIAASIRRFTKNCLRLKII